jgi:hypothetical protein
MVLWKVGYDHGDHGDIKLLENMWDVVGENEATWWV